MKKISIIILAFTLAFRAGAFEAIEVSHTGTGSPVIILPGLGGPAVWAETIAKLSKNNKCYLVRIKGIDGTQNPDTLDFDKVSTEITEFIVSEKLKKTSILAHSFGGFLAMQILSKNPGLAQSLILIDSYPFALAIYHPDINQEIGKQQAEIYRKQLLSLPNEHYSAFWMQNAKTMTIDSTHQKKVFDLLTQSEKKHIIEAQCLILENDLRVAIQNISCPILVLCSAPMLKNTGLDMAILKQRIEEQFNTIKVCSIFMHENARHFIMLDNSDWLLENTWKFLAKWN